MTRQELDFLRESNNIEDEWDDLSLQDAILAWEFIKNKTTISPANILKVHGLLMRNRTTITNAEKAVFRNGPIWIGNHEGKPWYAVPTLIQEWCDRANETVKSANLATKDDEDIFIDLENQIQQDHIHYESVHPFFDGNGRSGRILMNWQRVMCGLPIAVIKEKDKMSYYKWFK